MTDRHQELATRVVEAFKANLGEAARGHISAAQFEDLNLMIREALSEEREATAALLEELLRKLRADIERPELEL